MILRCLVILLVPVAPAIGFLAVPKHVRRTGWSTGGSSRRQMSYDRRGFLETSAAVVTGVVLLSPSLADAATEVGGNMRLGSESIMAPKAHGTSSDPVQSDLLYGVSNKLADKICNYNRHFAEMGGYFQSTNFEDTILNADGPVSFYDSVTGKPLFVAPVGRSAEEFVNESKVHGWPSFRDREVVWDNVRVLKNSGETVSVDGTHLGHNLPDRAGNRYCINLVSIAGQPSNPSVSE